MPNQSSPKVRLNHALLIALCALLVAMLGMPSCFAQSGRWTESEVNAWYSQQPWLVGANFIPAGAINQLEMWQTSTFDPVEIDRELGLAQGLGMNTMRVFLHNLLWEQNPQEFQQHIDQFLAIANKHHIRPIFVLFDSCWDPNPKLGPQHPPIPGIHNSGWVQAPGKEILSDPAQYPRLKSYVQGVIAAFAKDPRVLAWDLWNEPDNGNKSSYGSIELTNKTGLVLDLLPQVFAWAREVHPTQPLTSGIFQGDWRSLDKMSPMARLQIEESDFISFHNYGWPEQFEAAIHELQQYRRPLICTEYMARGAGSTFDTILPLAKKYHVGAINWGLVAGKSQTYLPWNSWQRPYVLEQPTVWFHDIFYANGTMYRPEEGVILRSLTERH